MINRYRQRARQVVELKLGELERLDVALPEFAPKPVVRMKTLAGIRPIGLHNPV